MTFEEVTACLPNGLHDAELQRFEMDYARRRLQFDLAVWIGDMDDGQIREAYRPARLVFDGVACFVVEPPNGVRLVLNGEPVRIDAGPGQPRQSSTRLPESPAENVVTWIYLEHTNAFLLFSAGDASLAWTGPAETR